MANHGHHQQRQLAGREAAVGRKEALHCVGDGEVIAEDALKNQGRQKAC
jgi:hypothetical protein